jgi:putative peptide zinc metalloprotease protein
MDMPLPLPLPLLREELDLLPGPRLPDGQPSWTLHDPERNKFFRIDWLTFEILKRWSLGDRQTISESIATATTIHPDQDDIGEVVKFLEENQLVVPRGRDSSVKLAERLKKIQGTPLKWLLHRYLFFRVPLLRPDRWLERMLPLVQPFYTRGFLLLTLLALSIGLMQIVRHSDTFWTSLVNTFNFAGLAAYAVALFVVKFLHELGHAFTAKRLGCRIPAIGVAFLVMWPMAYTDTNEAWRLVSRWQRLQVSIAGIVTELTIAAWATLAWGLLPEGDLRSAAFVLATTSLVATLVINASPFLRFDGYFILCDLLDMPNLHGRSFALARWKLREWLFALGEKKPEYFSMRKQFWMIVFAWATWLYRLVVYLAIALLVYHFFFKALGIFMAVVELLWFIVLPVASELKEWRARLPVLRTRAKSRRRSLRSLLLVLALLMLFMIPWPGRISSSGMLRPLDIWPVFAPGGALVTRFDYREGSEIAAGAELIVLQAPELEANSQIALARLETTRWLAASSGFSADSRERLQVSQQESAMAEAELLNINEELARYRPVAPFSGHLRDIDPDLKPGQWLMANEQIAVLVGSRPMQVETYLDEEAVKRIRVGDPGIFLIDSREGPVLKVQVTHIDADASRVLPDGKLTAQAGGHILIRQSQDGMVPELAMYRVMLDVEALPELFQHQSWRGQVVIRGAAEAPAARYLRNIIAVLVRESGL